MTHSYHRDHRLKFNSGGDYGHAPVTKTIVSTTEVDLAQKKKTAVGKI